ncbi:MAG: hypothetical protein U0L84_06200 [Acutalibacteraceae bacterium]|nr:hypothetical protein [Acutalibacteraceae bacterium]
MKKSFLYIIVANVFYMIIVAGTNFILPKYTSIETYAAVKEYTLYLTTYSTVLTFGYIQGMYVRYGGKEIAKINSAELGENIFSFFGFLLPIAIIISVFGIFTSNKILSVLGVGILSTNLQTYYQTFYQATGDFKSYGTALNISRVAVLVVNLALIFVFKTDNELLYIGVLPFIGVATAIYLTFKLNKKTNILKQLRFNVFEVKSNICGGFILMLGDFVTRFFSSVDRWFVNALMNTFSFALYSFAVSMEQMVNTFMSPITVSMYNYFCKKPSNSDIKRIKNVTLIYSFVIIAGAFPAKWILENFITKYIESSSVMFFLFAAQGVSAIIRGIYVNKYKADGEQKKYLQQMIFMLVLSILLNILAYLIFKSVSAIAAATLITNIVWLIWCEIKNPKIKCDFKVILAGIIMLFCYVICGYKFKAIFGCILYCCVGIITSVIFMKDTVSWLIYSFINIVKQKMVSGENEENKENH